MNFEVEHLGLAARDTVALARWYEETLGARIVFRNEETPPAFLLRLPPFLLEIYAAHLSSGETGNNRCAGFRHLALRVGSIEEARASLAARGVTITEEIKPAGGGGRVLFFKDPEGNILHLVERVAGFDL
jgi:glyoxylase I family protein